MVISERIKEIELGFNWVSSWAAEGKDSQA
jgi:hypothetical protein